MTGFMTSSICTLCGQANPELLYELPDYLLENLSVKNQLVRCRKCGLVFQFPQLSPEALAPHYPSSYDSYLAPGFSGTGKKGLLNRLKNYGIYKRRRIITRFASSGRLLDVGCASGEFLASFKDSPDWEVFGVELNPDVAAQARNQYGLEVFAGELAQAAFPTAFFDVITLWDVLEHVADPSALLLEIYRILNTGGRLVIRTPNIGSRDARWFGQAWAGLDSPRHLFVFSTQTLGAFLTRAGFKTIHKSANMGTYPLFVISVRFWLLSRGIKNPRAHWLIKLLNHTFIKIAAAPIFYLYGLLMQSPMLTVIATKEDKNA